MEGKMINLFGLKVDIVGLNEVVGWILKRKGGGKIYCCTLNEAVMASENKSFEKIIGKGDLLTADGMPLVWLMRKMKGKGERVYGPELMEEVFKADVNHKMRHFFLGSTEKNIKNIKKRLVGGYGYDEEDIKGFAPVFSDKFSRSNYLEMEKEIKNFGADIVWVGMGAEKQIIIANQLSRTIKNTIWVTVGAAFDFFSGSKRQAPKWLRNGGGEWLFRLGCEPRRVGGRYLKILRFLFKYYGRLLIVSLSSREPGNGKV